MPSKFVLVANIRHGFEFKNAQADVRQLYVQVSADSQSKTTDTVEYMNNMVSWGSVLRLDLTHIPQNILFKIYDAKNNMLGSCNLKVENNLDENLFQPFTVKDGLIELQDGLGRIDVKVDLQQHPDWEKKDPSTMDQITDNIQSGIESIKQVFGANEDKKEAQSDVKLSSHNEKPVELSTYDKQSGKKPEQVSAQKQEKHPGNEHEMKEKPQYLAPWYKGSGKLLNKVAIITGADSGIGRSVAILFAREGCKGVVIAYLNEDKDAHETRVLVEKEGATAFLFRADLKQKKNCIDLVEKTIKQFGQLDILVNNAGEQHATEDICEITDEHFMNTWHTKFFSMFWITQHALKYLKEGSCIINTSSVTAYAGKDTLVDYSATNGAIVSFTRALALQLASKKIRVNSVAPGPIWTPLIPSSFGRDLNTKTVEEFGQNSTLGRPGQPEEVAPSYVFLAAQDSSYFTGQVLHPNGGKIINA